MERDKTIGKLYTFAKKIDPEALLLPDGIEVKIGEYRIKLEAFNKKFVANHLNKFKSLKVFHKIEDIKQYLKVFKSRIK